MLPEPHRIIQVIALPDYHVKVTFEDNKTKVVNLGHLAGKGVFEPFLTPGYFERVCIESGTIVWPDGQDLCPDALYEEGVDVP